MTGVPEVALLQDQWAIDDSGNWRADVTFIDTPPMACMVYAQDTPPAGGDTIWASTRAAYASLSQPVRDFLSAADREPRFRALLFGGTLRAHGFGP